MSDRYETMLPRLAEHARRHPRLYRAQVAALAMLGYGLLLGVLALLVAATVFVVVAGIRTGGNAALWKLALALVVMRGVVVDSLWIQIPAPRGMVLGRGEAPALWAEIERVRRELRAPAPYQVLISGELNASVQQVPRLGIFGFYRTYITIGLPLAASLTADEFRSVLAHEYGHVAGQHGRFGVWVYRVRETWTQLLAELQERRSVTVVVFRAFVRWYAPFLEAYTTVLRREHEFEADRDAARVAGAAAGATALCRLGIVSRYMDEVFWPSVTRSLGEQPQAPSNLYRRLLDEAPDAAAHPDAPRWLAEDTARATEPWDSHPSLADRLAALGIAPALPAAQARPSGAEAFLGDRAAPLADRLGRRWADTMQFNWREQHNQQLQMAQRLSALEARVDEQPLPPAEARERILLTVQLHGATVAMPLMRDFVDTGQDDAGVHFMLGRELLGQDDEAGLRHLERAMEMDWEATSEGCALAAAFLQARGRTAEADTFRQRAQTHEEMLHRAAVERHADNVSHKDVFLPHALSDEQAQGLSTHLSTVRGLKRALLVRKQVTVLPDLPLYVLAVEPVWKPEDVEGGHNPSDKLAERVLSSVSLPGTLLVATLGDETRALGKSITQVPGAVVFSRAGAARAGAR